MCAHLEKLPTRSTCHCCDKGISVYHSSNCTEKQMWHGDTIPSSANNCLMSTASLTLWNHIAQNPKQALRETTHIQQESVPLNSPLKTENHKSSFGVLGTQQHIVSIKMISRLGEISLIIYGYYGELLEEIIGCFEIISHLIFSRRNFT